MRKSCRFYANRFIAAGFTYAAWLVWNGKGLRAAGWANLHFVVLETRFRRTLPSGTSRLSFPMDQEGRSKV